MSGMEGGLDPSNPESIQQLLGSGVLEPEETPEQQMALRRLETLLALVEGWVDTVVAEAVGERLPGAGALRETLRRRRATGGPAEQTFATLIGLELRPRRLRAAAELWEAVGESRGTDGRDALWADPGLLPSGKDLDDPKGFVERDKQFTELLAGLDDIETQLLGKPADDAPGTQAPTDDAERPDEEPPRPV
jgi:putative hydrolase